MERNGDGNIVGKTDVGKYMAKRLGFDYRPISELQKIKELYDTIQLLRVMKERGDLSYDSNLLAELQINCDDLRHQIHMEKE